MSEKILSEGEWKSFAKGQKLDDPKVASKDTKALHDAVLEALQALGKKDDGKPDEMLEALDKFEGVLNKQVAANAKRKDKDGKAIKDTKDVKDQLYKMLAAVEKQRKELSAAKAKQEEAEEEEESPALLTTKMLPLLRELRKGQLVTQALIALAGKETVVLLSRKPISPARGKLLKEQMTNPSGLKFVRGECLLEANALTFVVQSQASGLAKKLKAALLAQTELKLKVRVRGEDPEDLDEDDGGEDGEPGEPGEAAQVNRPAPPDAAKLAFAKRLLKLKAEVDKAVVRGDARSEKLLEHLAAARQKVQDGDTAAGDDELSALEKLLAETPTGAGEEAKAPDDSTANPKLAFNARLKALMPAIQQAIDGPPPNAEVKRLLASIGLHAKKGDFGDAHAVLDEIEAALRRTAASSTVAPTATSDQPARRAAGAMSPRAAFTASRLLWAQTRDKIRSELRRLESAVLDECKDEPDFATIKANSGVLYSVLDHLDERLIDKLDEALNARDAEERRRLNEQALEIVNEYLEFVQDSELLHDIDDNGFLNIPIKALLDERLADLAQKLGQAVAA